MKLKFNKSIYASQFLQNNNNKIFGIIFKKYKLKKNKMCL